MNANELITERQSLPSQEKKKSNWIKNESMFPPNSANCKLKCVWKKTWYGMTIIWLWLIAIAIVTRRGEEKKNRKNDVWFSSYSWSYIAVLDKRIWLWIRVAAWRTTILTHFNTATDKLRRLISCNRLSHTTRPNNDAFCLLWVLLGFIVFT